MKKHKKKKYSFVPEYSLPLKLNQQERRKLISNYLDFLISNHYKSFGHLDFIKEPLEPEENLPFVKETLELWKENFTSEKFKYEVKNTIKNIIEREAFGLINNNSIFFTPAEKEAAKPKIYLPEACEKFSKIVRTKKLNLNNHYLLVLDALYAINTDDFSCFLEQLLNSTIIKILHLGLIDNEPWITDAISQKNNISFTTGIIFILINRSLFELLTLLLTLPWEIELKKCIVKPKMKIL